MYPEGLGIWTSTQTESLHFHLMEGKNAEFLTIKSKLKTNARFYTEPCGRDKEKVTVR